MSTEDELALLRAELVRLRETIDRLADRQAILDCVQRHARGVDRHDAELTDSCYHPDGGARYGEEVVGAVGHGEWSNRAHAEHFALHLHHITTHTCEIDGDSAWCESYFLGAFLAPDQPRASMVSGRYLDQLERRGGEWRIVVRRTVVDVCAEGDASFLGAFRTGEVEVGELWSRDDISYRRPLDLDTPGPAWS